MQVLSAKKGRRERERDGGREREGRERGREREGGKVVSCSIFHCPLNVTIFFLYISCICDKDKRECYCCQRCVCSEGMSPTLATRLAHADGRRDNRGA